MGKLGFGITLMNIQDIIVHNPDFKKKVGFVSTNLIQVLTVIREEKLSMGKIGVPSPFSCRIRSIFVDFVVKAD